MILAVFFQEVFKPRHVFALSLLVSIVALVAAFMAQFGLDLKPCILCLYARIPFAILKLVCVVALFRPELEVFFFLVLITVVFFASFGLSVFHVGVEQHWWELSSGCPVEPLNAKTTQMALAELLTTPQVPCDQVAWRILGISVVIWNALLAFGMGGYVTLATTLFLRDRKRA